MASIRSSGTAPERLVRSSLHRRGFRFGQATQLPGRPDVVLPKYRTAVFVHGCFWHGHEECTRAKLPKTNEAWWADKVRGNRERDARVEADLGSMGWRVLSVWTCELRPSKSAMQVLDRLTAALMPAELSRTDAILTAG